MTGTRTNPYKPSPTAVKILRAIAAGSITTGKAAERLGRRWLVTDSVLDYLRGGAERFRGCEGFEMPVAVGQWQGKVAA